MVNRFAGRVAVVTGGGGGIGRATAALLAAEGASVAVADIDADAAHLAASGAVGRGGLALELDVTDEASVERAFNAVNAELGTPTVLIHCAGGSRKDDARVTDLATAVLDETLALEVRGLALCARAAVPGMQAAGGGSVVVFTSFHALGGEHHAHAYVAAKGALLTLARTMAASYAADGVRVNALAPGIVLTDRVQARVDASGVDLADLTAHHPGAVGSPDDIARVAAFLASEDARMITGAVIPADGGLTAF